MQVYHNGLKLLISNTKICIDNSDWLINGSHIIQLNKINEGEPTRKLALDKLSIFNEKKTNEGEMGKPKRRQCITCILE